MATGFKVTELSLSRTPWVNVHGENRELVAQWQLNTPYTGPIGTPDGIEWVHYPNGYLKLRYRVDQEVPNISDSELETMGGNELTAYFDSLPPGEVYGVRYLVPAEVFSSAESAQVYVAGRLAEFLLNRLSYLMTNGQYHQGTL